MASNRPVPRQERLVEMLVEARKEAGLTQTALAEEMGRYQSVIASMESGKRRIDVVELLDLAQVIGFDIHAFIDELLTTPAQVA